MPIPIEFSNELITWAEAAGFNFTQASVTEDEWKSFIKDRAFFSNRGGELIHFIDSRQDGWLLVTDSERMGREQFEFAARSLVVLERYFLGYFGEAIRSRRGLAELDIPAFEDELSPGFCIRVLDFDGSSRRALVDPSGGVVAISWNDAMIGTGTLVQLSAYLNSSVSDLQASFQSQDGQPLFGLWEPPAQKPGPAVTEPRPVAVSEADVAELVGLIAADDYVNGINEDVIAHRRAGAQKPPIRRDESWDGYVYFFYVGDGFTKSSGFRYDARQAAQPFSVPFGVTEGTERRIEGVLARVRDAGDLPLERRWNAAAVVYDRGSGRGDVRFFYGRDAENWQMSPADADRIAAQGLALLHQVQGR